MLRYHEGCVVFTPFWPLLVLFFQWLGVTRASDPPPCSLRKLFFSRACCLVIILSMLMGTGMVIYAAPKKSPNVFLSMRYSHSREYSIV